jgi:hypothetical protein
MSEETSNYLHRTNDFLRVVCDIESCLKQEISGYFIFFSFHGLGRIACFSSELISGTFSASDIL